MLLGELSKEVETYLEFVHNNDANNSNTCIDIKVPRTTEERRQLGNYCLKILNTKI